METQIKLLFLIIVLFVDSVAAQLVPRPSSAAEWRALLELRASLGITAKQWNRKANPCLNWTGIQCSNGHVTGINLSGLRRTRLRKLSPRFDIDSLPSFSMLSVFNSSGFTLKGSIPEWLGRKLSNLTSLDLRSSSIYGSIPRSIGGLTKLRTLFLANNSIAGSMPPALGNLVSLSVLDLSQNLLTGQIPTELWALRNLTKLDLSSNYLSGGIAVDRSSLPSLKCLNLSNNSLSGMIPAELGNLSQLTELDLGFNSMAGSLPEELGGLTQLRKMLVGDNELEGSLSDVLFQTFTSLESLVLSGNYFVGELPLSLWSISHLEYLDVSRNNLTGVLPDLTSVNASGSTFNLSNNQFFGNLSSIGRFNVVDVSSNYIRGSAPKASAGTRLFLSNNCLSNETAQRVSDICSKFYMERGMDFENGIVKAPQRRPVVNRSRKRFVFIMTGCGLGFIVFLMLGTLLFFRVCCGRPVVTDQNVRPVPRGVSDEASKVVIDISCMGEAFSYAEMLLATDNFSTANLIKRGHSGDLFRGTLEGERLVVVKRVDLLSVREEVFMLELEFFGKISHPKLVPLVGHCFEDEQEKFLVYKYMPNGDLSNALFRLTNSEENMLSLDWITRLKIATGAAEALSYLHHECTPPVIHRDVHATSILLDDKYEVRLGSFSKAGTFEAHKKVSKLLHAPQTSRKRPSGSSPATCAYDVYCLGKVLLELVTGKLGSSRVDNADEKQWLDSTLSFISMHEKELIVNIVDESLIIYEDLLEEVWAVSLIAKACLSRKASRRPSMRNVLRALENPFKVVREENLSSVLMRTTSRQSWTAALFGSWHPSSSGSSNKSGQTNREGSSGPRQSERLGSRGSGANDHSSSLKSSRKRSSSDVFPEQVDIQDVERQDRTR